MKIVSIVGARPQFIKAALLSKKLARRHKHIILHTGQHFDFNMSDIFFSQLEIPRPKYNLGVASLPKPEMIKKMVPRIVRVLEREKPHAVVVYGDTNSTLAGALAAKQLGIRVAHVEAGMRSYDNSMPEEKNRVETDRISDIFFCPTSQAVSNLRKEGIVKNVYNVGDLMVDLLKISLGIAGKKSKILGHFGLEKKKYYLATVHRASNTDSKSRLAGILGAFSKMKLPVIFPVHPRTAQMIANYGLDSLLMPVNIIAIEPVSYYDMLILEKNASLILTDSGGMQKEAYILKVPCVTLRDSTEWTETVKDRWNFLAGKSTAGIMPAVKKAIMAKGSRKKLPSHYGNGKTAEQIAVILEKLR